MYDLNNLENAITDQNGDFVSGLTVTYEVRKSVDNSLVASGTMTEEGDVYKISISFSVEGQYRALYITPTGYENGTETILVEDATDLIALNDKLIRVLGLSQENYKIFNPTYVTKNNQACMTSATIKIYPTPADVDADTNAIAEYTVTATFDNSARMTNYKVKKV